MYILYNSVKYPCKCRPAKTMIYRELTDDFPVEITGEIKLYADDGFLMRVDNIKDYLRCVLHDGVLTLTNEPEPEPHEQETNPEPIINPQDDMDTMIVDHEYRIVMLELGVSE